MEEGGGGGGGGSESGKVTTSFQSVNGRQRFTVELRPGETTIVSWKKLLKDAAKVSGPPVVPEPPSNAHPALESRIAPGQALPDEVNNASPGNRLSAVIEKIESLYKGKHSSDEEDLNEIPDDDEYDTDDSFIDDTELDEYFEVDNSAIKHDGFFVNRGKLERIETSSLPNQQPKKRLRKDLSKGQGESGDGHAQNKNAKVGKKTAGSSALLIGKNSSIPSDSIAVPGAHYEDANVMSASELYSNTKFTNAKAAKNPSSGIPNGEIVLGVKAIEKQKLEVPPLKNHVIKLKDGSHFSDASNQVLNDKNSCVQHKSQRAKTIDNVNNIVVQQKEQTGLREQPDSNISEGKSSMKSPKVPQTQRKDVSSVRPKSSMLEKAIRELEKIVAESRPSTTDVQVADAQAVKRRLRPEIKQKLAKVARLAQASNGKISKELINRLMTIVGHLMQLRTLKRNLNVMINNGLLAKKEKDDRFQQIKREVIEMLKVRAPLLKSKEVDQQAGVSDNFQEVGQEQKEPKRKFSMDDLLEDKICDLYDLYIDGLEEDGGRQVKKLYAELAELWPSGFMDNHGIKRAICRAKERRRALYNRRKDQEKIKRKMLTNKTEGIRVDATSSIAQPQYIQQKQVADSSFNGSTSHLKQVNNTTVANLAARIPIPFSSGPSIDRQKHDKGSTSNVGDTRADALPKKKVKRKPESELSEANIRPDKLNSAQGEERHKSQKQVTASLQPTNFQSAGPPNFQ